MSDQSFLTSTAVATVTTDQTTAAASEKDVTAILSKRVDDGQKHIENMHAKLDSYGEVINKQKDLIDKLLAGAANLGSDAQQTNSENTSPAIDSAKLIEHTKALVKETFQQQDAERSAAEAKKKQEANLEAVSSELTARFGAGVDAMVTKIAAENDMTFEEALTLARVKPKVLLGLFPKATPLQQSTQPGVNNAGLQSHLTQDLPKMDIGNTKSMLAYYDALKAKLEKQA